MDKGEYAVELKHNGHNCAQAVLCAFRDRIGLDERILLRTASALGGGISGTHENACGAITGMIVAYGLITGYDDITDLELKKKVYAEGGELVFLRKLY